jgi:hypothetical protein
MFRGVFNDEDNAPMNDDAFDRAQEEQIPFAEPEHPNGCWNCQNYDWTHEACTTNWNNMDESYYCPEVDDRKPDEVCEYWELNPDAEWGDWHDT